MKKAYETQAQILTEGRQELLDHKKAKYVSELAQEIPRCDIDASMNQLNAIGAAYDRGFNDCLDVWIEFLKSC